MLSNFWGSLSSWFNAPFSIIFVLCLVIGVAQLIGLGGDVEHDADADSNADHDINHDADGSLALVWLAFLGVGKAPIAVILLLLFGAISILGWVLNSAVQRIFGDYPSIAFVPVVLAALMGGALITSRASRFIGRALPPISTTAMRAQALVGKRGTVISPFVDDKYGQVRVRDQGGTQINVFAVTYSTPIARGSDVALVSYDMAQKRFTVERL